MTDAPANRVPAPRWRRALRLVAIALAIVALLIAAALAWLASDSALIRLLAEVTARSGGALTFDGVNGSLLSEMRARRVEYRDAHVHVVADDVALTWSPVALWSRELRVRGLGAKHIVVTLIPSDAPASPPQSLALPVDVSVEHAGVALLDLVSGDAARRVEGIAFGYAGGATVHRFTDVVLTSEWGRIGGDVALAANPPFGVRGAVQLRGSERLRGANANVTLGGSLVALDTRFSARAGTAFADGHALVEPLAAIPLVKATIDARDVDLAQVDASWPRTMIAVKVEAGADAQRRYAGTFDATNSAPGPFDAESVPLTALRSRFAVTAERLELTELAAQFGAGGSASGRGRVELATGAAVPPSEWDLAVRELDLARIWRPAIATRLAGSVRAHVERGRQHVDANLAQGDRALAFVATIVGDDVDIERFRARAGSGEATGRAKVSLRGARRFDIAATTTRFDPSRFIAAPAASLDGTIDASGQLAAPWSAEGRVTLQPTSRLAGLVASGSARGRVSASTISDATIDARFGDATVHAQGSFGRPGDTLAFTLDAPQLSTLASLVGSRWPAGLAGRWHAAGTLTGDPDGPGVELTAQGKRLTYATYAIGGLDVRASIVPARTKAGPLVLRIAERPLAVAVSATDVQTPQGRYAKGSFAIDGTLARHVATAMLVGEDLDAQARLEGGFTPAATLAAPAWTGMLAAFDNRGAYAMHLAAPARLAWARERLELGEARITLVDGDFRIAAFNWREGRLDTRGAFTGVPAAAIARVAGAQLPMRSTLVLGGDWDVAAAPRLTGTVHAKRERGDLFAGATGVFAAGEIALGLETLELAATLANDTVDAKASLRASALGVATATLRIGNVADGRIGTIAPDAPVTATLKADIASLKPLQPLLGTSALVDGRITVDGEAKGTRKDLALSGSIVASDVKLAAPQYGVQWSNGRIRARLAGGVLALDELSLEAGDGRFVASGTLVAFSRTNAGTTVQPTTSVTWHAERFRATNRPDMRLVVDGDGTLGASEGRLLLKGELKAREGRFELERPSTSTLGPDVVVAGVRRPPPEERFHDVPLAVDLNLDLGDRLYVSGRGLDARLAGRVHVATTASRQLTARGTIRTVTGTYDAFGQRLTIQRGRLIFDGPIDNPALDVVAVRRNLAVEAGVEVTGTVNVPHVQLVSDPPVPDGEKLSWLVLGQGLDRTSSADAAALQAAAATLFGENRAPLGTTLARQIGLDDIALRSAPTTAGGNSALGGQVLAVSKRLSDKLYIIYEQGLTVANNALKIEYVLTRNLTLRGEAGTVSGVGVYYQRSFE